MSQTTGQILSYSAKRGTLREYETVLIVRPETNKDGIKDLVVRVQSIFAGEKAQLQKIENWGLRTLSFPIRHCKRGIYLYVRYLAGSSTVAELERIMRNREDVIRFLSIRIDEDVDPNVRPSEVTAEVIDAATESAPDPLDFVAPVDDRDDDEEEEDGNEGDDDSDDGDEE